MTKIFRLRSLFSVSKEEMNTFSKIKGWWDPSGPMSILYQYNYLRVKFLRDNLERIHNLTSQETKPFQNLKIVDAGCGAGILSESMARLGGNVLAIDPNQNSIKQAQNHKQNNPSLSTLKYSQTTVEQLLKQNQGKFDVVTSMEVVQHVQNPRQFIGGLSRLLKDRGVIMMSTIKRNWVSYLTHILIAEHLTRIVPVGTHHHQKFINPQELQQYLQQNNCFIVQKKSLAVTPFGNFVQCQKGDNYMIIAQKRS